MKRSSKFHLELKKFLGAEDTSTNSNDVEELCQLACVRKPITNGLLLSLGTAKMSDPNRAKLLFMLLGRESSNSRGDSRALLKAIDNQRQSIYVRTRGPGGEAEREAFRNSPIDMDLLPATSPERPIVDPGQNEDLTGVENVTDREEEERESRPKRKTRAPAVPDHVIHRTRKVWRNKVVYKTRYIRDTAMSQRLNRKSRLVVQLRATVRSKDKELSMMKVHHLFKVYFK